jgi:hypothetical protein
MKKNLILLAEILLCCPTAWSLESFSKRTTAISSNYRAKSNHLGLSKVSSWFQFPLVSFSVIFEKFLNKDVKLREGFTPQRTDLATLQDTVTGKPSP